MKQIDTQKALDSLKYAGWLGHEFVGLRANYETSCEVNTLESAQKSTPEDGSVWQQISKGKWKQVA